MIGRSYVRNRSHIDDPVTGKKIQPPEGYDSIYIEEDTRQVSDPLFQKISHTYAVFSSEKVRLLYKVRVKITRKEDKSLIYCDICKTTNPLINFGDNNQNLSQPKLATCYCVYDQTYFCDEHFQRFHSTDDFNSHQDKVIPLENNKDFKNHENGALVASSSQKTHANGGPSAGLGMRVSSRQNLS